MPECENRWYGPYTTLLRQILFPEWQTYTVSPQSPPYKTSRISIGFVLRGTVRKEISPLFIVEIKNAPHIQYGWARKLADTQIRLRFPYVGPQSHHIFFQHGLHQLPCSREGRSHYSSVFIAQPSGSPQVRLLASYVFRAVPELPVIPIVLKNTD